MAAGAAAAAAGGNISTIPAASITHLKAHAFNWLILLVLVGLLRSLCTAPCFASGELAVADLNGLAASHAG